MASGPMMRPRTLTRMSTRKYSALAVATSVGTCLANFGGYIGAAFLVKNKFEEGKEYIAKKILLGSLQKGEQESAMMEVNLLKNLKHPNIVAYKTSFISQGILIIIMEYCEGKYQELLIKIIVGDLSFHIKRRSAKGERFTETEIFNWFV